MNPGRTLAGLILVALGTLFLLDALEVVDAGRTIRNGWPVALIAVGVVQLIDQRRVSLGPVIVILLGLALLGGTTGVAPLDWSLLWPAVLILLGVWVIVRRGGSESEGDSRDGDRVSATALLSGRELRSKSRAFAGGSLTAILGGVEVDLRDAELAKGGAALDVTAILGGFDLVIPEHWHVDMRATTILGGIDDETHGRSRGGDAPTLTITGLMLLGGGDIKNS